jgi:hypothetical protein
MARGPVFAKSSMNWVLFATCVCYGGVILPILYALQVQGVRRIGELWGLAPNQFFFLLVPFPFACFYIFTALRLLVTDVVRQVPETTQTRLILQHWPAGVLLCFAFVAVVSFVVYVGSNMSLDKLRPTFADVALHAIQRFDEKIESVPEPERAKTRQALVDAAKRTAGRLDASTPKRSGLLDKWLEQQEPEVSLQFLVRPQYQREFDLLDPTIHALNVFQLFLALSVGAMMLFVVILVTHVTRLVAYPNVPNPSLRDVIHLLTGALFLFGLYPLFYHQQRVQLEEFVGQGFSVLQDVFAAVFVAGLLVWLASLDPADKLLSIAAFARVLPLVLVTGGFALAGLSPVLLRQLVGRDTTLGIQLMMSVVCVAASAFPILYVWARSNL